nr:hypothetical protein [Tanacetum cinerariifolium]
MIQAQVGDLSSHSTKYSSPALTQKVFANMRRVGKGFSRVDMPLFEGMIVAQQADDVADEGAADVDVDVDVVVVVAKIAEIEENADVQGRQADATIIADTTPITVVAITTSLSAARRRKGVVIRYPEETVTPSIIIHSEPKSKDKGKGIMVEEPKPLKKQAQIEQDEAFARELEAELNKNINWDDMIDQVVLKRKTESQAEKAVKKPKLDEEVVELKKHLQIVPNDDDDVYTEATPLARKVPVVDYEIYTEKNKPYYKIIRADGSS